MGQYRTCPVCGDNLDAGETCWCRKEHQGHTGYDGSPRTDFTYHINDSCGAPVLVIEDLDQGGMSVTNNIAAVLRTICMEHGAWAITRPVVCRDSEGSYDGVDGRRIRSGYPFFCLGAHSEEEAVKAALERAGVKSNAS